MVARSYELSLVGSIPLHLSYFSPSIASALSTHRNAQGIRYVCTSYGFFHNNEFFSFIRNVEVLLEYSLSYYSSASAFISALLTTMQARNSLTLFWRISQKFVPKLLLASTKDAKAAQLVGYIFFEFKNHVKISLGSTLRHGSSNP